MYSFEQSIEIGASLTIVEHCLTERSLMRQWLNPSLRCDPVGEWSVALGAKSRFVLQIPLWEPALSNEVVEREPGLIVWQFNGFFTGNDRWECCPLPLDRDGHPKTQLLNRFEFEIPNPWVNLGFRLGAAQWTQQDMRNQLQRIKRLAEALARESTKA